VNKKEAIINIAILVIYISLQIFLAMHHEAWRDESQAWIIAKNASFGEMLGLCASEGHPCMWFFILKILSLCGFSFYWFSAISITIMAVAASLFLWKCPFPTVLKVAVLLSPVFFYYNPVICRIYAVLVLLIVVLCIIWPERRDHPVVYGIIVALLFQSHILIAGFAMGCLIEMLIRRKDTFKNNKNILGFAVSALSMLCMIAELKQADNTETFIHVTPGLLVSRIGAVIQNIMTVTGKYDSGNYRTGIIILLLFAIMISIYIAKIIMDHSKRKTGEDILIVSLCGLLYYWGIIIFVRGADHSQIAAVFWMIMLFFIWTVSSVADNTGLFRMNIYELLLLACCVLVIPRSAWIDPVSDVKGPFSGSREMATIVEETVPDKSIIAIRNNELSPSIAAYLYESEKNYIIWDIDNGCEFQIHKWGRENKRIITDDMIAETVYKDCGRIANCYYISGTKALDPEQLQTGKMTLIKKNTSPNTWDEYYQLYKLSNVVDSNG